MSDELSLPLLDLRELDAGAERRAAFLLKLRQTARDVGFFYLAGHGVSEQEAADYELRSQLQKKIRSWK